MDNFLYFGALSEVFSNGLWKSVFVVYWSGVTVLEHVQAVLT